ncbi:hypothetical protein GSY74_03385 [Sulfurovum sp. bin170]|uniref:hypothetical protein n=1 Tax=Sulfurovum sp. bin170 TaxID=2695268 RepID=UPI0013DE9E01|nr:hypothetical protein [Sulfurovum sp. bin170]NEW60316.1 hypothetical protein [Sulfurovum sp. bin170]
MNLMILKRFRNELIISVATIFALSAFSYKISANSFVEDRKADIESSISEISRVSELKKLWRAKQTAKDAKLLKTIVAKEKVKSFKKTSEKVTVSYTELNIKELNMIIKKIMNRPFQISKLKVFETAKERYGMELTCRW